MYKKYIILIVSMSLISVIGASQITFAGDAREQAKLSRVAVADYGDGVAYLWAEGGWKNQSGVCEGGLESPLAFDPTTEVGKAILTIATDALLSGNTVEVYTSGCFNYPTLKPRVNRIDIIRIIR